MAARNFIEYNDIEISPRKFKLKVRLPKPIIRQKEAITKEEIREILLKCSNIKLKTYLMLLLASTGTTIPAGATTGVSIVPDSSILTDSAYQPNPVQVNVANIVTWTNDEFNYTHSDIRRRDKTRRQV